MNKLLLALVLMLVASIYMTGCTNNPTDKPKQENKEATKTEKPKEDPKTTDPSQASKDKKTDKQEPDKEEAVFKGKTAREWAKQLKDRDETIQMDAINALGQLKSDADTKECIHALITTYVNPLSTDRVQDASKNVLLDLPPESVLVPVARAWAKVWGNGGREDDKYGRLVLAIDDYNLSRGQALKAVPPLTSLLREAVKNKDMLLCASIANIFGGFERGNAREAVPVLEDAKSFCQGRALGVVENAIRKHGSASK